ncbi:TetR/AcrR family transcriptional regulator [Anaerosporobacter faecicola]|uniref:TetR/AcrR family transcriptional regulator n=1 Tax=Anaerosporobacter faecicola TaxID=2718714 RepID=UPI00143A39CC|nr:TetR/AcrR family transcriptional regulator [Anaerosporobacter faecicola]
MVENNPITSIDIKPTKEEKPTKEKRPTKEKKHTKEKILEVALELFSERGYEGVSMRDIAAAVNIKGSSIYKHYKGKQDIMDSILALVDRRYEKSLLESNIPIGNAVEVSSIYVNIDEERLVTIVWDMFQYFVKDPYVIKYRKILMMEQYKNNSMQQMLQKIYYDNALAFQEELFKILIEQGEIKAYPPKILAIQFYSPIFLLIFRYDGMNGEEEKVKELLKEHVHTFFTVYHL